MASHKYRQILEKLQDDISSGRYKPGKRLPSEAELVRRFGACRMTVFRAMRELQSLGLVTRRVGSGTFVSPRPNTGSHVFGLLIPELGQTEIFEAICKGMMEAQEAMHHSLLWGNAAPQEHEKEQAAEQLCEHYIARKVSGVFFAPLEFSTNRFQANHRIVAALDRARISVVPAFVKEVARQLGEVRGLSAEEVGIRTTRNFYRFFSLHEKANSI